MGSRVKDPKVLPVQKGEIIRILPTLSYTRVRTVKITLVNDRVFSARPVDGINEHGWGGPIEGLIEGLTFERVEDVD